MNRVEKIIIDYTMDHWDVARHSSHVRKQMVELMTKGLVEAHTKTKQPTKE